MRRHVYYYTLVPTPFVEASGVLEDGPARWLPPPAAARDGAWEVALRADGALPAGVDRVMALVTVGPTVVHGSQMLRSVSWQSAAAEALFPKLDADLALDRLGGEGCHFSLIGSYRPPLSVVGGAGDRLYGHRVAEACVRRFVLDVADRLATVGDRR